MAQGDQRVRQLLFLLSLALLPSFDTMGKVKFVSQSDMKIGVIADEDTVTGLVLAGIGHVDGKGQKNYLVVDSKVHQKEIEEAFTAMTERNDMAMILITQGC